MRMLSSLLAEEQEIRIIGVEHTEALPGIYGGPEDHDPIPNRRAIRLAIEAKIALRRRAAKTAAWLAEKAAKQASR